MTTPKFRLSAIEKGLYGPWHGFARQTLNNAVNDDTDGNTGWILTGWILAAIVIGAVVICALRSLASKENEIYHDLKNVNKDDGPMTCLPQCRRRKHASNIIGV